MVDPHGRPDGRPARPARARAQSPYASSRPTSGAITSPDAAPRPRRPPVPEPRWWTATRVRVVGGLILLGVLGVVVWALLGSERQVGERELAPTSRRSSPATAPSTDAASPAITAVAPTFSENRASGKRSAPYSVQTARVLPAVTRPDDWTWPVWPLEADVELSYVGEPSLGVLLESRGPDDDLPFGGSAERIGEGQMVTPTADSGTGVIGASDTAIASVLAFDLGPTPTDDTAVGVGCRREGWAAELVVADGGRWRLLAGPTDGQGNLSAPVTDGRAKVRGTRSTVSLTCTVDPRATGPGMVTELVGRLGGVEVLRVNATTPRADPLWTGLVNLFGSSPILVRGVAVHDPLEPPVRPGPLPFRPGPIIRNDRFPEQAQTWIDANGQRPNGGGPRATVEASGLGVSFPSDATDPVRAPGDPVDAHGILVGADLAEGGGAGCALAGGEPSDAFGFVVGPDGAWELRRGDGRSVEGVDPRYALEPASWRPRRVDMACTLDRGGRRGMEPGRSVVLRVVAFIDSRAVVDRVETRSGTYPLSRWVATLPATGTPGRLPRSAVIAGVQVATLP